LLRQARAGRGRGRGYSRTARAAVIAALPPTAALVR
jgi:hypothetical protein